MRAEEFLEQVQELLKRELGAETHRILEQGSYGGGMGADLTIELRSLYVRLSTERGDFWIDVAGPNNREEWHGLVNLLLLTSGAPISRESVLVGKDFAKLARDFRDLLSHLQEVYDCLSAENVKSTEERLAVIRKQTSHPLLKRFQ
jgi:hypothetical protein